MLSVEAAPELAHILVWRRVSGIRRWDDDPAARPPSDHLTLAATRVVALCCCCCSLLVGGRPWDPLPGWVSGPIFGGRHRSHLLGRLFCDSLPGGSLSCLTGGCRHLVDHQPMGPYKPWLSWPVRWLIRGPWDVHKWLLDWQIGGNCNPWLE